MRTHPLIALAVVGATIFTVTVFGQSAPLAPPPAVAKKPRHPVAVPALQPTRSSAVPAWLAPPGAASAPAPAAPARQGAGRRGPGPGLSPAAAAS